MQTEAREGKPAWKPVAHATDAYLESEGYVLLSVEIEGEEPDELVYRYQWNYPTGTAGESTGNQHVQTFLFFPPFQGRFILCANVTDEHGLTQTASVPVTCGDVGAYDETEEIVFERPAISYDTADTVISVQDVSMVFNIASEQFNSLKEYFIALARHEVNFKPFRALDHVSFDIQRGEAFGLVGTNGSGKSTMLKIIAGVLDASEGTCTVRGSIAPLIELGAGFDVELTARENIYLNGALLGYRKEFIDDHFDQIVEFAELENFLDIPIKNYSSGMVARIAFAIATVTEPDILIVDETLSVGDFLFQQKCQRRIQELIGSGNVTVLLVSHSIDLIESICDRVCWIEKGEQRMIGPAADVCAAYRNLRA